MLIPGKDYKEPNNLTKQDLTDGTAAYAIIEAMEQLEAETYIANVIRRAPDVGVPVSEIRSKFNAAKKMMRGTKVISISGQPMPEVEGIQLNWTEKGVANSIENYIRIMRDDPFFREVKFNEMSDNPEITENGHTRRWADADDAKAQHIIEEKYGLYNPQKYTTAFRAFLAERAYNPIQEEIEKLVWDQRPRIETLLIKWLGCEDTPYTREVSRLIFAGGINRLYRPGCKFDDVPILIGTKQGEGKSTFVRFLAIKDDFFREITEINGKEGAEQIEGAWVCEMSELLALTRAKEVEAVKSFITRQKETYRKAYGKYVGEYERRCIFIGTTNRRQFLTDKTGNRRFYPVVVHSNGYELFEHEQEIRADIAQCWAEAKYLFDNNQLPAFANGKIINLIRAEQDDAIEEDWRVDTIRDYVADKPEFCIRELWLYALKQDRDIQKKDSTDISAILQGIPGVYRARNPKRLGEYGMTRYWVNPNANNPETIKQQVLDKFNDIEDGSDIPF